MTNSMSDAEAAVRNYLLWLEDPTALRDDAAVEQAKSKVDEAADPIDRLRAIADLKRLEEVDGDSYRQAFLARAHGWAETNGISVDAFRELGVSPQDLRDAGFAISGGRSAKPVEKGRRRRVNPDQIRSAIPGRPFRVADLEAASGASTATVRKVIAEDIEAGTLVDLGPDQSHAGRGRAPSLYRKA